MDELNNKQLVLIVMLVSFVVSIATGIITVAMLEEAPQTLTQTVNRVVERTIERVVTGTSTVEAPAPIITNVTKEVTVYAKEDDLVISAVEKNLPRIARIYGPDTATSSPADAIGFVVSRDGLIALPKSKMMTGENITYAVIVDGKTFTATPMEGKKDDTTPVAFLKIKFLPDGMTLDAVSFGRHVTPKTGQTVVVLGGEDGTDVMKVTLTKIHYSDETSASSTQKLLSAETLPKLTENMLGGLVVNLDGQAVGVVLWSSAEERYSIFPTERIIGLISTPDSTEKGSAVNFDGVIVNPAV